MLSYCPIRFSPPPHSAIYFLLTLLASAVRFLFSAWISDIPRLAKGQARDPEGDRSCLDDLYVRQKMFPRLSEKYKPQGDQVLKF